MNNIYEVMDKLEKGLADEDGPNKEEGVIVVDSVEEYMTQNRAVRLDDLDKALKVND